MRRRSAGSGGDDVAVRVVAAPVAVARVGGQLVEDVEGAVARLGGCRREARLLEQEARDDGALQHAAVAEACARELSEARGVAVVARGAVAERLEHVRRGAEALNHFLPRLVHRPSRRTPAQVLRDQLGRLGLPSARHAGHHDRLVAHARPLFKQVGIRRLRGGEQVRRHAHRVLREGEGARLEGGAHRGLVVERGDRLARVDGEEDARAGESVRQLRRTARDGVGEQRVVGERGELRAVGVVLRARAGLEGLGWIGHRHRSRGAGGRGAGLGEERG
mmetsp:Transcript_41925/g.104220  ORF Transcript_41925/g.104220 Transcript_41925/m.104220 type:complete len:277 (+) Transcript_41925:1736-2566(+)